MMVKFLVSLVSAASLWTTFAVAGGSEMSRVDVRITDHRAGIEDFTRLDVSIASVALHRKGEGRKAGWFELNVDPRFVDIVPLKDGLFESVGIFDVPAKRYDAVRVRFAGTDSEMIIPDPPPVKVKDTTVAIALDLRGVEGIGVVIDLYAEDLRDHSPQSYAVKIKEIRIEK